MPIIKIMLRTGELLPVVRETDEEIQFLVRDIVTRRTEQNGLIQIQIKPGTQCLFFASEVVRMDVHELANEDLRITRIV